jgi:hypothetical protein
MGNMSDKEMDKLRVMLVSNGDIMVTLFDILRKLDSRVLMLLKLNELTRALDNALSTTHPPVSLFSLALRLADMQTVSRVLNRCTVLQSSCVSLIVHYIAPANIQ